MYRRLYLIRNNELDGRRLEWVLWIEPDHEMKDLILDEAFQIKKSGEYGSREIRRGVERTLYKLSPSTSIEKYHVLRSSAWSS